MGLPGQQWRARSQESHGVGFERGRHYPSRRRSKSLLTHFEVSFGATGKPGKKSADQKDKRLQAINWRSKEDPGIPQGYMQNRYTSAGSGVLGSKFCFHVRVEKQGRAGSWSDYIYPIWNQIVFEIRKCMLSESSEWESELNSKWSGCGFWVFWVLTNVYFNFLHVEVFFTSLLKVE